MDALKGQIGGDHYAKLQYQPIEFIVKNNLPFITGNIVKYIVRYKDKNGAQDIHKIIHYCELAEQLERRKRWKFWRRRRPNGATLAELAFFNQMNELTDTQARIIFLAIHEKWRVVIQKCFEILRTEYGY